MTIVGRAKRRAWRDVARSALERRVDTNGEQSRRNQARWPCTQPEVKVAFVTARWVGLRRDRRVPKARRIRPWRRVIRRRHR